MPCSQHRGFRALIDADENAADMPATTTVPLQLNAHWGWREASAGEVARRIVAFQAQALRRHKRLGYISARRNGRWT